jgi:two-component system response regulator FlrC
MPRILIVDDERAIRSVLSVSFVRAGYEVATAASAKEAMSRCAEGPFDAVLSDVDMPGMNGHELMRWIAANRPANVCVLMSGCSFECAQCPFARQCILLPKPFTPRQAIALVTDGLKRFSELN